MTMNHVRPQTESWSAATTGAKVSQGAEQEYGERAAGSESAQQNCCISCFRLMPPPSKSSPPENCEPDQATGPHEPELLCPSCILHLAGKSGSKSPAVQPVGGVLSPLPKLSLLVKAEAKCQDQLQLLRGQQEILKQQRESLQATKRAKEEALAAERELARQRRKHFLTIQERRKREEELRFQQFQAEEHTSRSEQEGGADKPKKKKPKPPKAAASLLRRKSDPVGGMDGSEGSLPHVTEPTPKLTEGAPPHVHGNIDSGSSAETHTTSLYERRRQMMACYSQDLSPLIDGHKPRRLPFPKPTIAIGMAKRRQTLDNNAQITTLTNNHRSNSQHNSRKQGKIPAPKTTKLRPLENQKRYIKAKPQQHASNQSEEAYTRVHNDSARVSSPQLSLEHPRRLADSSTPLTAEIKPVSWAYELAKDVLPQEDPHDEAIVMSFSAPLQSVPEENSFTLFPLQRQLPNPTFPPSQPVPKAEVITKVPRWEYSAERLSSLLEKYNVSVSAATTATSK
ncbi:unnamed protein product [Phytophthora fragariaefolia]|uniref:Unnamed protein product n=1 Tax=Phytophthora fragariaefolia TaxID=1490495 RepID=A0A9W6UB15_9STRA|nr:unnamed protein product [Phytophthora fragariaefolia]